MHYGDKKHLKEAVLELIIYKHRDLTVERTKDIFSYEICSIHNAKYIDAYNIWELWDEFDEMFPKQLKKIEEECFYLVTFKYELKKGDWKLVWNKELKITDKMFKKDPFLGLH